MTANRLWYKQQAKTWVEALPLGNGRLGAMVFGGVREERLAMNEDTFWAGYPMDKNAPDAHKYLPKVQQLVREGDLAQAQQMAEQHLEGKYSVSYLPLCDVHIRHHLPDGEPQQYVRDLNMRHGLAGTKFTLNGVQHERRVFVSYPDQAMVVQLTADQPGAVSFCVGLTAQVKNTLHVQGDTMILDLLAPSRMEPVYVETADASGYGDVPERQGMRARVLLQVQAKGGTMEAGQDAITVTGADAATLYFCARTSFAGFDKHPETQGSDEKAAVRQDMDAVAAQPFDKLLAAHLKDVSDIFDRVRFALDLPRDHSLATDERLRAFADNQNDPELFELIFNYGRYLLFSSSRPGTQAANLQGIWNQELRPPWSSNYTVNINTEMNYWPAEPCAMPEMHGPLFDLIERLRVNGRRTAQLHYGAQGVVCHHNTDLWAMTNPVGENRKGSAVYAIWPMSYGWLCQHLMEHYDYSLDKEFLRDRALPAITDAAVFFLDVLKDCGTGHWSIYPATSPENSFMYRGERLAITRWATMSNAIVREVFGNMLRIRDILGLTGDIYEKIEAMLPKLPPYQVGSQGQLLEWDQEYPEPEPHHRHISHLYPLHPGREFSVARTPDMAHAVKRTLELRGDDGTGWALGWKISQWARLHDGDHALRLLKRQLRLVEGEGTNYSSGGGTYPNLLDAHPPFQIDGNFAASAGVAEMLLQNAQGEITLLPALPSEWSQGSIHGLRAFAGLTVDMDFAQGQLTKATLTAHADQTVHMKVIYQNKTADITLNKGETAQLTMKDFR